MSQTDLEKLAELLKNPINIAITSHYNPDGDAVGSSLALYHVLIQSGHNVSVLFPNRFPAFLNWIEGSDRCMFFDQDKAAVTGILSKADLIFCLDYNAPKRLGEMGESLKEATAFKILIDHHPAPELESFSKAFHDTKFSSTSELIYQFLSQLNLTEKINLQAAESLYTGIITDTGSLSFSCNRPETYRIIAKLIEKGLDAERAHRLIYDNFTEGRMRLLGYSIYRKMMVFPEYHTALIPLTISELEEFQYEQGDTEGLVNYPLSMKTINMSVMMVQRADRIRLSFRSKGDFHVNEIASRYFAGGGHRNAAGGDSFVSMEDTILKIREILPLFTEKLNFEIK